MSLLDEIDDPIADMARGLQHPDPDATPEEVRRYREDYYVNLYNRIANPDIDRAPSLVESIQGTNNLGAIGGMLASIFVTLTTWLHSDVGPADLNGQIAYMTPQAGEPVYYADMSNASLPEGLEDTAMGDAQLAYQRSFATAAAGSTNSSQETVVAAAPSPGAGNTNSG